MTPNDPRGLPRRPSATAGVVSLVAAAALLPLARGLLSGSSFYFRDLTLYFPQRRYALEGLRSLELRFWNPFSHEGTPVFPPLFYPLDLLQALWPDERGISLFLALHLPLAAAALFFLARDLALVRPAAAGGALAYALGGFALSTINLYVYVLALAWAPFVILTLRRAARGLRRDIALAALVVGVAVSTSGIEIVAQAVVAGAVLSAGLAPRWWARLGLGVALGLGLSAALLLVGGGVTATESERAAGFQTAVVLSHSVHPLTLLQVVVGGLYGDHQSRPTEAWWGLNFFPKGFPYFLSLYLGLTTLALAAVGVLWGRPPARRLAVLALLAVVVSLGRWAGLAPLVDALPFLHRFRFPSKAFFTVHLAVALLAALGLGALNAEEGRRRAWRWLLAFALGGGGILAAAPWVVGAFPAVTRWFASGFFPPHFSWPLRLERLAFMAEDARLGGLVALAAALVGGLVLGRRLSPRVGILSLSALACADLLRCGAGLNPMVDPAFFRPSPEMAAMARTLREEGGRAFSFDPETSPAYWEARLRRGGTHEVWTFATMIELQVPDCNVPQRLPSALSFDRLMVVPASRVLRPDDSGPSGLPALVPRLRRAGVAHVLSLDPLEHPDLERRAVVRPDRLAPLAVQVYRLRRPLPLRAVARELRPASTPGELPDSAYQAAGGTIVDGQVAPTTGANGGVLESREGGDQIEMVVESDRATVVLVRDAFAPGWRATVNGVPAPVLRADGRHRAVPISAGRSRVVLTYRPPGLVAGLVSTALSSLVVAWLGRPASRSV